jgi:hypothetical protein
VFCHQGSIIAKKCQPLEKICTLMQNLPYLAKWNPVETVKTLIRKCKKVLVMVPIVHRLFRSRERFIFVEGPLTRVEPARDVPEVAGVVVHPD